MDPRLGWRTAVLGTFCPTLDSLLVSSEYLASYVDSGLLFATSFGRVVAAWRHSQRSQGDFDVLGGEPNLLQRFDALVFFFFGRLRYPVIGSDGVVGVWVVDAYVRSSRLRMKAGENS